jgi:hypothetical protein
VSELQAAPFSFFAAEDGMGKTLHDTPDDLRTLRSLGPRFGEKWGSALFALIVGLIPNAIAAADAGSAAFHVPDAVLLNITEQDLNHILTESFRIDGTRRFTGTTSEVSRGVYDLHYSADLSEPVLTLGENGQAWIRMGILEADLRIGRIERKIGSRMARCENTGLEVERERPVDITLALNLVVDDHDLHIVPEHVELSKPKKSFRLIKPERCQNTVLPKWLLWWVGKPYLRRKIGKLDEILLARASSSAARLNAEDGLLIEHWRLGDDEVFLYPQALETDGASLLVSFAGSTSMRGDEARSAPDWISSVPRSFLGLSELFLNTVLRHVVADLEAQPQKPSGNFSRLFRSQSVFALIPGLRHVESRENIYFTFGFQSPPAIELRPMSEDAGDGEQAMLFVDFAGLEMSMWESGSSQDRWLGTLAIDSGRVGLVPYVNHLGGVSFELAENDWTLSSTGVEFNEELFAALIQELIFGEAFETRYDPLGRDGLHVGDAQFQPRYFSVISDYLVIAFDRI